VDQRKEKGHVLTEVHDLDTDDKGHDQRSAVFTLQQKYATEFQLITAAKLDRERTAHYALNIRCQDGGGVSGRGQRASRVTEKSLQVHVTDMNDNAPAFSKQTYRGSITENNFIGASVLQVGHGHLVLLLHVIHSRCANFTWEQYATLYRRRALARSVSK